MAKPPVKAKQLADVLAERIRVGDISEGDWLPSERELAAQYSVGRSTVQLALDMLTEAGLTEDLGTRVKVLPIESPRNQGGPDDSESARLQELERRVQAVEERLDQLTGGE